MAPTLNDDLQKARTRVALVLQRLERVDYTLEFQDIRTEEVIECCEQLQLAAEDLNTASKYLKLHFGVRIEDLV